MQQQTEQCERCRERKSARRFHFHIPRRFYDGTARTTALALIFGGEFGNVPPFRCEKCDRTGRFISFTQSLVTPVSRVVDPSLPLHCDLCVVSSVFEQTRRFVCNKCLNNAPFIDYHKRNEALRMMGFASYKEYLQSSVWQVIRSAVLERDYGRCFRCSRPGNQVHHYSYELDVLLGKDLSKLLTLCDRCHRRVEFDGDVKLDFREVRKRSRPSKRRRRYIRGWQLQETNP